MIYKLAIRCLDVLNSQRFKEIKMYQLSMQIDFIGSDKTNKGSTTFSLVLPGREVSLTDQNSSKEDCDQMTLYLFYILVEDSIIYKNYRSIV